MKVRVISFAAIVKGNLCTVSELFCCRRLKLLWALAIVDGAKWIAGFVVEIEVAKHGLLASSCQTFNSAELGVGGEPEAAVHKRAAGDVLLEGLASAGVAPKQEGVNLIFEKGEALGDFAVCGCDGVAEGSFSLVGGAVI